MEDSIAFCSLSLYFILYLFFVCVLQFWGCSAPYSRILGVLKHLQHPPSYASVYEHKYLPCDGLVSHSLTRFAGKRLVKGLAVRDYLVVVAVHSLDHVYVLETTPLWLTQRRIN